MRANDRDAIVTPSDDTVSSGGGVTESVHQQWVMRSINDLREDFRESTRRVDQMHEKITQQSIAFERMTRSLESIESILREQSGKFDKIDTSVRDMEKTISNVKNRVLGGLSVFACFAGLITYFFGEKLSVIAKAVIALH